MYVFGQHKIFNLNQLIFFNIVVYFFMSKTLFPYQKLRISFILLFLQNLFRYRSVFRSYGKYTTCKSNYRPHYKILIETKIHQLFSQILQILHFHNLTNAHTFHPRKLNFRHQEILLIG